MQQRAEAAWKAVSEVKNQSQEDQKKHAALARRLPALIRSSGLGQTLAFLRAKKGKEHDWIRNHLSAWVLSQLPQKSSHGDLLDWILQKETDQRSYRYATQEALAYLQWLKRFAESELK